MKLIEFRSVSKAYYLKGLVSKRKQYVFKGLSFVIEKGQSVVLKGPSGIGKTTIGLILLGLEPYEGSVLYKGKELSMLIKTRKSRLEYAKNVQMAFQDTFQCFDPRWKVYASLEEPLKLHYPKLGPLERKERIIDLLSALNLDVACVGRFPHQLSGGQRQRLNIARCLLLMPELLILDEPVSSLDKKNAEELVALLSGLKDRFGLTYLIITHDDRCLKPIAQITFELKGKNKGCNLAV